MYLLSLCRQIIKANDIRMEKIDILRTMRAHGLMAKDVAERLSITTVAMSQQMTGNPRLETLRKIADTIGCNIRDFFYIVDENGNDIEPLEGQESGDETKQENEVMFCPRCGTKFMVINNKGYEEN